MSAGAEIDSEAKKNEVTVTSNGYTNHCLVIMEQGAIEFDATAPRWRISASLLVVDEDVGVNFEADLPFITIRPIQHKRQIVAIAHVPMIVSKWTFRFESDAGRAKAMVWLVPGISMPFECGIFEVPHGR
ncbi:MAG TPA: hypothetical protein PK156_42625 [Polyangium sp.]|nr:hypothetical protein [Polyangium sp.]